MGYSVAAQSAGGNCEDKRCNYAVVVEVEVKVKVGDGDEIEIEGSELASMRQLGQMVVKWLRIGG